MPWAARCGSGSRRWRRAGVSAAVAVVALAMLVVAGVVGPSRAGADGLRSNALRPDQTTVLALPCDVYGWTRGVGDLYPAMLIYDVGRENRWVDRAPILRAAGREIVFADGNALYAASVHGTHLWRPIREYAAFYVGGRWRYALEGIVSFDVSRVDGALVYATCWTYQADGGDPETARTGGRLAYPAGDVQFDVGDDLYQITVVRPEVGTVTDLYPGNFPAWSPDGRRLAFVSTYWRTVKGAAGGPPSRVIRVDSMSPTGGDQRSLVQTMAADGTDLRTIALPAGRYADFPPRWSPDGTRLAFLATEDGARGRPTFAIYTVGADGTGLQRLAAARSNPAWSPDGTRLAFVQANGDLNLYLYTMAADGTDVRQVSSRPVGSMRTEYSWGQALAWSPNGSQILYRCRSLACVVGLDGQLVGRLEYQHRRIGAWIPAWMGDGRRIGLYNAADGGRDEVVLASVAPDGSDGRVLVRAGADGGLVADQVENFLFPGPVATRAACRGGVVVPAPAQHPGLVADCEVLVALRATLFGWAGTNWTANTPLGEWEGVVVRGAPARVRELVLTDGAIATFDHGGQLPAGMAELAFLERLELSKNGLTGTIPAAWGALARLWWLDLSGNQLSGAIPGELGQLGNLERLRLYNNQLTGAIPAALGELGNLEALWLFNNQLSGAIPPELGQLQVLEELYLADSQLTGAIPPELGQLRNLERLWLADNQLTGAIPAQLGQLRNLERLNLHNNQLTGTIPAQLGQLQNIWGLELHNNQLTGTIPVALSRSRNLERLWLHNNQLTGAIPAGLGRMEALRALFLGGNQLTGCIPAGLRRLEEHDLAKLGRPDCEAGA